MTHVCKECGTVMKKCKASNRNQASDYDTTTWCYDYCYCPKCDEHYFITRDCIKKAVVDVDEILWSFSRAFYDEVVESGIQFPVPEEWNYWSIFWAYLPKDAAFPFFDKVHSKQSTYKPYPDAKRFLQFLKDEGFHIIIASHRDPKYREELVKWLDLYELPYDEVHISFDKTVLFSDKEVELVVDDRPETLVKGERAGVMAIGLLKPWNRRCGRLKLFKSFKDMERYIKTGYMEDDGREKR